MLSISANLAAYYSHQEQFRFVPEYVIRAFAVTALWGLVVPLVVNCLVKIMKGDMPALAVHSHNIAVAMHIRVFAAVVPGTHCCLLHPFPVLAGRNAQSRGFLQLRVPSAKLPQLYRKRPPSKRIPAAHLHHNLRGSQLPSRQAGLLQQYCPNSPDSNHPSPQLS